MTFCLVLFRLKFLICDLLKCSHLIRVIVRKIPVSSLIFCHDFVFTAVQSLERRLNNVIAAVRSCFFSDLLTGVFWRVIQQLVISLCVFVSCSRLLVLP